MDTFRYVRSVVENRLETAKLDLADAEATLLIREAEVKTSKADWIEIRYDGSVTFWKK